MPENVVPAHDQTVTHRYRIHYPAHEPRETDPHYRDFEAYRHRTRASAECQFGVDRVGDFSECGGNLELHHAHIEFALINAVDLALLEARYPGVSVVGEVGEWVNGSADNLMWLCEKHHRGLGGIHHAAAADWEAEHFIRNLIS
ncbi:hypothetical protein GCM10023196_036820 [Actinoallomurus vinaceus]|uniref:HNH endonuclease n=1 Tax=Actinoallomurus vinaceus TaxID=1080074 RepID=A0ABP8UC04_9ACTN